MYLHGIGKVAEASSRSSGKGSRQDAAATVDRADALAQPSGRKFDMILANPPFGKKGGYTSLLQHPPQTLVARLPDPGPIRGPNPLS